MITTNHKLIYDRDHGPDNYGWYTRHDEYTDDGIVLNIGVDEPVGDSDTTLDEALIEACDKFGISQDEIDIFD